MLDSFDSLFVYIYLDGKKKTTFNNKFKTK